MCARFDADPAAYMQLQGGDIEEVDAEDEGVDGAAAPAEVSEALPDAPDASLPVGAAGAHVDAQPAEASQTA